MSAPSAFGAAGRHRDGITIPTLWLATALSLALHALLLLGVLPLLRSAELIQPSDDERRGRTYGSLAVRMAPPPRPPVVAAPASPAATPAPPQARRIPAQKAAPAPSPSPPVLAMPQPAPGAAATPAPTATPPADFAAFVEARRRTRQQLEGEPRAARPPDPRPAETEQERTNREAAERLGLSNAPSFGSNTNRGGGIFQVMSLGERRATVAFFGWNKAIRRNSLQTIEVERGEHPSIELAVVRRMIALIREQGVTGDFTWESQRLKRDVELSARLADNGQLEAFLLTEFFARVAR